MMALNGHTSPVDVQLTRGTSVSFELDTTQHTISRPKLMTNLRLALQELGQRKCCGILLAHTQGQRLEPPLQQKAAVGVQAPSQMVQLISDLQGITQFEPSGCFPGCYSSAKALPPGSMMRDGKLCHVPGSNRPHKHELLQAATDLTWRMRSAEEQTTPQMRSEWPFKYFVALCSTMSNPHSAGLHPIKPSTGA